MWATWNWIYRHHQPHWCYQGPYLGQFGSFLLSEYPFFVKDLLDDNMGASFPQDISF